MTEKQLKDHIAKNVTELPEGITLQVGSYGDETHDIQALLGRIDHEGGVEQTFIYGITTISTPNKKLNKAWNKAAQASAALDEILEEIYATEPKGE